MYLQPFMSNNPLHFISHTSKLDICPIAFFFLNQPLSHSSVKNCHERTCFSVKNENYLEKYHYSCVKVFFLSTNKIIALILKPPFENNFSISNNKFFIKKKKQDIRLPQPVNKTKNKIQTAFQKINKNRTLNSYNI